MFVAECWRLMVTPEVRDTSDLCGTNKNGQSKNPKQIRFEPGWTLDGPTFLGST